MTDERDALRKIAALNYTDAEFGEFRLIARKALGKPETPKAAQTALRTAESHVAQRRQELQAAVLQAREHRSLADIARELGVSKQRVEQISKGR